MAVALDILRVQFEASTGKFKKGVGSARRHVNNLREDINRTKEETKKSVEGMSGAMFGFGLSVLFGGMAIKNFSQNLLTNMGTVFSELVDSQHAALKQILAVQAGLSFLKFAIFDAFANSELFDMMTNKLLSMATGLAEFIGQHPMVGTMISSFLVLGVVLGSIGMVLGQAVLLAIGFGVSVGTVTAFTFGLAAALAIVVGLLTSDMPKGSKVLLTFGLLFAGLVTLANKFNKAAVVMSLTTGKWIKWLVNARFVSLTFAIIGSIVAINNMKHAMGGWWNFGKSVIAGFMKLFMQLGSFVAQRVVKRFEQLLSILSMVADVVGFESWASGLARAAQHAKNVRVEVAKTAQSNIEAIEREFGIGDIRAQNDALTQGNLLMNLVTGRRIEPGTMPAQPEISSLGVEDTVNEMRRNNESIQNLSGGTSLADIDKRQQQNNQRLQELIDKQDSIGLNPETQSNFSKLLAEQLGPTVAQALLVRSGSMYSSTER